MFADIQCQHDSHILFDLRLQLQLMLCLCFDELTKFVE